jgi:hypothetical protein
VVSVGSGAPRRTANRAAAGRKSAESLPRKWLILLVLFMRIVLRKGAFWRFRGERLTVSATWLLNSDMSIQHSRLFGGAANREIDRMPYINLNGTPEGDEQCRRLILRAQAARDQREALFREFYGAMNDDERAEFREYLRLRLKVESGLRWSLIRHCRLVMPSPYEMREATKSLDFPAEASD